MATGTDEPDAPTSVAILAPLKAEPSAPIQVPLLVDVTISAAALTGMACLRAARRVRSLTRPLAAQVLRPPLLHSDYWPETALRSFAEQGRQARLELGRRVGTAADELLPAVVARIDVARIVNSLDIDAIVAQLDIPALVGRMDLNAVVLQVINDIDLPTIIRDSSGLLASETVTGVRTLSIDADERVNRIVDRLLLRRGDRRLSTVLSSGEPAASGAK